MIGIISDTHDSLDAIKRAVELFNSLKVELVVHAGDYVAPFTSREFRKLNCRFLGVYGNNDGERLGLRREYSKLGAELQEFLELEFSDKRLAVYHGTHEAFVKALVESNAYDVVITGHSHRAEVALRGGVLLVNPGEACGYLSGRKTVGILEVERLESRIIELE